MAGQDTLTFTDADFDRDVVQAAPLAVNGDRVVRRVGHAVGFIIAHHQIMPLPEPGQQRKGKAPLGRPTQRRR